MAAFSGGGSTQLSRRASPVGKWLWHRRMCVSCLSDVAPNIPCCKYNIIYSVWPALSSSFFQENVGAGLSEQIVEAEAVCLSMDVAPTLGMGVFSGCTCSFS